jgi:hypothetical protein
MRAPKIYVDFGNADAKGRVRLNCNGTLEDLARLKIQLSQGLTLTLYSDDEDADGKPDELRVSGTSEYSAEEQTWVAVIDWSAIHHASDEQSHVPAPRSTRNAG